MHIINNAYRVANVTITIPVINKIFTISQKIVINIKSLSFFYYILGRNIFIVSNKYTPFNKNVKGLSTDVQRPNFEHFVRNNNVSHKSLSKNPTENREYAFGQGLFERFAYTINVVHNNLLFVKSKFSRPGLGLFVATNIGLRLHKALTNKAVYLLCAFCDPTGN